MALVMKNESMEWKIKATGQRIGIEDKTSVCSLAVMMVILLSYIKVMDAVIATFVLLNIPIIKILFPSFPLSYGK